LARQRIYWKRHPSYNTRRRPAARRYKHDYGTKYVGVNCKPPTCRCCGDDVPFSGRGRPFLECPPCRAKLRAKRLGNWGGRRGTYVTDPA